MRTRRVAHFLLLPELLYSPPNNAIICAYIANNFIVDIYAPGNLPLQTHYGTRVKTYHADYTWLWIFRNILSKPWYTYDIVSGTSEDPFGIVGIISLFFNKKSLCLVDEIKSGSYRGDRSELWKKLCRLAIKRSRIKIVNDESRVNLLIDYARLKHNRDILVYPGCFYERPTKSSQIRFKYRQEWGFTDEAFIIASSGGFNLTAGAEWLLACIKANKDLFAVIQPLGLTPLSMYLLKNLDYNKRLFIQDKRMDWFDAWESAQAFDIGVCIYSNPAPQFQKMGISSNRLCMFIAMGVPVIASRQSSFEFLEEYDCGVLVDSYDDFCKGVNYLRGKREIMKNNCEICYQSYIKPHDRYKDLCERINNLI